MALIKKDKAGSAPGYVWENDGDVVEVTDPDLATELTHIPDGGFSEVIPDAEVTEPGPEGEKKSPAKKPAAKKAAAAKAEDKPDADADDPEADKAEVTEPGPEGENPVSE